MKLAALRVHLIPEAILPLPIPDCNVYVIGTENEFYIIDSGNGFTAKDKIEKLEAAGFKLQYCRGLICTHSHFDHINGAHAFNTEVSMHEADAAHLMSAPGAVYGNAELEELAKGAGLAHNEIKIRHLLKDGDKFSVAGDSWRVIHSPGHTPGSICLYRDDATLISGDTLFATSIGRTDFAGSNSQQMKQTLQRLKQMNIKSLLPGHGQTLQNAGAQIDLIVNHFATIL